MCHFGARTNGLNHSFVAFGPILVINGLIVLKIIFKNFFNRKTRKIFLFFFFKKNIKFFTQTFFFFFLAIQKLNNENKMNTLSNQDFNNPLIINAQNITNETENNNIRNENDFNETKINYLYKNNSLFCDFYFC